MSFRTLAKGMLGVAAVSLWGLAPGCGPSVAQYCNKACDCAGCSESERDGCVDVLEDFKEKAEKEGCGSEYNDALGCLTSELECRDGSIDADGCDSESEALNKCMSGAGTSGPNPGANACQIYQDAVISKYVSCGLDAPDVGQVTSCPPESANQATCLTGCVDLITCGCLTGQACSSETAQPYSDCVSTCL